MTVYQQSMLQLETSGRSINNITRQLLERVESSGIVTGLCHVFIRHTSASLIVTENADPDVHIDLELSLIHISEPTRPY